jgi:hypothetical protein
MIWRLRRRCLHALRHLACVETCPNTPPPKAQLTYGRACFFAPRHIYIIYTKNGLGPSVTYLVSLKGPPDEREFTTPVMPHAPLPSSIQWINVLPCFGIKLQHDAWEAGIAWV